MTRISIVRPADRLEDHRYVHRLLAVGVTRDDIRRGFVEVGGLHAYGLGHVIAAARRSGASDVLDIADVDTLVPPSEGVMCTTLDADERVERATQAMHALVLGLRKPIQLGIRAVVTEAAEALTDLSSWRLDSLVACSRAEIDAYRAGVGELVAALSAGFHLDLDVAPLGSDAIADMESVVAHAWSDVGLPPPQVRAALSEPVCATSYSVFGYELARDDCTETATFSLLP